MEGLPAPKTPRKESGLLPGHLKISSNGRIFYAAISNRINMLGLCKRFGYSLPIKLFILIITDGNDWRGLFQLRVKKPIPRPSGGN